ncbi:4-oxalocrotonate tautomerase family protein [Xylogone sp. PMI_703]|nr:4-oxalocrotonate tautomerase family protein [Xylogone sp. PMI_703]
MPVIDVYSPPGLFPADKERDLVVALGLAALRAEGFPNPPSEICDLVGTFFHPRSIYTANAANTAETRIVRLHVTAGSGGFNSAAAESFVTEATRLVAEACGDPSQAQRTWIYITETISDGLALGGTIVSKERTRAAREAAQ